MSIIRKKEKGCFKYAVYIIIIVILIILVSIVVPTKVIENGEIEKVKILNQMIKKDESKVSKTYNISDLMHYIQLNTTEVTIQEENDLPYYTKENGDYNVKIVVPKYQQNNYKIEYKVGEDYKEQPIVDEVTNIKLDFSIEGPNFCNIIVKENNEVVKEWSKTIYYIEEYKKQFAEDLTKQYICAHFEHNWADVKNMDLIKYLGVKGIRGDIVLTRIFKYKEDGDFERTDKWIQKANELGINIFAILNTDSANKTVFGDDGKVSCEEDLNKITELSKIVAQRYPNIEEYEIINEPNEFYKTDDDMIWYGKLTKSITQQLKLINNKIKTTSGATSVGLNAKNLREFYKEVTKYGAYDSDNFSIHKYQFTLDGISLGMKNDIIKQQQIINDRGGFQKLSISEFGIATRDDVATEEQQPICMIQQINMHRKYNLDINSLYDFKDHTDVHSNQKFGVVRDDYTPKPSYYILKRFLENTNGAEYMGTVQFDIENSKNDLEINVHNKDGKPKIIVWAKNGKKVNIPYQGFTAQDLYGNDIEPDEQGNILIDVTPIYINGMSRKYFYQAISNEMTEKYTEFETKFAEQIPQVSDLQQKITQMKQTATEIGTHSEQSEIAEAKAIEMMNEHYALGNMLIEAYKGGSLAVEDVKLSSMLDSLNGIGDSYEDLVTITAQTRNANFEETNQKIQDTENVIKNGEDLDNIYPSKILDFAKEFNEKATYINNLDEENDIKTGLIVSKNLHSNLLADWAKQFADVYIDKYLQENPVQEITYSTEDGQEYKIENLTNKSVIATLPTTDDMQITSEGGNTHTFEQNGSFTFKYTRRGRDFEAVVNIENIDKDAPIITGVENNKLYTSQVSINVEDKNLKDVKLICNEEEIQYDLNTPLKEEGIYEINATDKVENSTKKVFQLVENASEDYNIGDEYITNIQGKTTQEELRKKLLSSVEYDVKRNDETLNENEIIKTGDTIETKDMHQKYTLIVAGDINKNGEVDLRDFVKLRKYLLGQIQFEGIEKMAADTNVDDKEIGIKDFVRMRIILLSN